MNAIKFDFDIGDVVIGANGSFVTANTDNQNVALISISQVCRALYPEIGAQIGSRMLNVPTANVDSVLASAARMAENDGATDVSVSIVDGQLIFRGNYDN